MPKLQLIYAPNKIFKQKALEVLEVDDEIRVIIDQMFEVMKIEKAVGLGANMVGLLKRIVVVDLNENKISNPLPFVNPKIISKSKSVQEFEEASLSYPGISAKVKRHSVIELEYLDYEGKKQKGKYEGFMATVLQHEIDYLDGVVYLDYLSKMKRELLLKKMQKYISSHPPHIHDKNCKH